MHASPCQACIVAQVPAGHLYSQHLCMAGHQNPRGSPLKYKRMHVGNGLACLQVGSRSAVEQVSALAFEQHSVPQRLLQKQGHARSACWRISSVGRVESRSSPVAATHGAQSLLLPTTALAGRGQAVTYSCELRAVSHEHRNYAM
jgi:hypothetical protein